MHWTARAMIIARAVQALIVKCEGYLMQKGHLMGQKLFCFVVTIILSVGLSGCSSTEDAPEKGDERLAGSLTELFHMGLDTMNPSEVEREAIERAIIAGRIDSADYEAAHVRYVQCMARHGYQPTFRKTAEGLYIELPDLAVDDFTASDMAHTDCYGDNRVIGALYRMQQSNPDLLADYRLLAIQCLKKGGFVDAGYTVEDFERDQEVSQRNPATDGFPFDPYEDGPSDCLYVAGYAYFSV
ncbi:MAG: hypothetical protein LBL55_09750 [Propionibacteriaceae bacterium]|jgi:uncharacterized protein YjhX (UPF0386 family)|nr:hypothetical protein [Propionibacteriaceae bacterium]